MDWERTLEALALEYGIAPGYWDIRGKYVSVPQETLVVCLEAMGVADFSPEGLQKSLEEVKSMKEAFAFTVQVLRKRRKKLRVPPGTGPGEVFVCNEQGESVFSSSFSSQTLEIILPEDAPWGYYELFLKPRKGQEMSALLIFAPREAYLEDTRIWGIHGALFALTTKRSQGIGDLRDLEAVQEALLASGGEFLGLLPLHLMAKKMPEGISPYLPLSRVLFDPIYLPLEGVLALFPGMDLPLPQIPVGALIDYEETWKVKNAFLQEVFRRFWEEREGGFALLWNEFQEFLRREGEWLFPSSLYQAIALWEGPDWRTWPLPLRRRDTDALSAFSKDHEYEVCYFAFLQWLMHRLLQKITAEHRVLSFDLPVGCAPSGIESWLAQENMVFTVTVGAPPDDFSPKGQNWGIHPFSPQRMRETRYRDFIRLLRLNMRFARFLRLDHIMGLKRLFWIPEGKEASSGTYVTYPFRELLAILTLESVRNKVTLIGEDLGTVPRFLRSVLRRSAILSTRVFYFERDGNAPRPPQEYPRRSYATLNTHDMPPLLAFLEGRDITKRVELGMLSPEEGAALLADRNAFVAACFEKLRIWGFLWGEDILPALLRFLAATPSLVVSVSIDDLLGSITQLNLPGTVGEYPNWRHHIVLDLDELKKRLWLCASLFCFERGNEHCEEGF